MDKVTEVKDDEEDRLDTAVGLTLKSRLSCQTELTGGPVKIRIGPHR